MLVLAVGFMVAALAKGQEELDIPAEALPRVPALEPEEAIDSFELLPGFHLELVAAEPDVVDPVAMTVDENGRLYVAEFRGYSEDEELHLGQIRLLEDIDGDGRMDKSAVFAEGLAWPTAVACWDGGVFVASAPDLFYLKDTDGDDRADVKETVLTGFGTGNVQGLFNSFDWGLDNRFHIVLSGNGGEIRRPDQPESEAVEIRRRDIALDPRTRQWEIETGNGQWGLGFDDWGRKFTCTNGDHLRLVMYDGRYSNRSRHLPAPNPIESIAADGPQGPVYRISPVERWRVIRTELRREGKVPGPLEARGRVAGYFSSATSTTVYRGDAYPEELRGLVFLGEVSANVVSRKAIENDGVSFIGKRFDPGKEFLASRDIWFRPTDLMNAPDGTLWVADMYREVVEHPKSLPPPIKQHLDLTSGRDRGRIYRIAPDGYEQRPTPRLSEASTEDLVALLAHENAWHRETASRLIFQRQDAAAIEPLETLARSAPSPLARIHALSSLSGLGALDEATLLAALEDDHPRIREFAVERAETRLASTPKLRKQLVRMAGDPDIHVRFQLAFTLGEWSGPARDAALVQLAQQDAGDHWMRFAILSSMAELADRFLVQLSAGGRFAASDEGRGLLEELAKLACRQEETTGRIASVRAIEQLGTERPRAVAAVLRGLRAGSNLETSSLRSLLENADSKTGVKVYDALVSSAGETATDTTAALDERRAAIDTLTLTSFDETAPILGRLLAADQPTEIQQAAMAALGAFSGPGATQMIFDVWPELLPAVRGEALNVLLANRDRALALLDAIEAGEIPPAELRPQDIHQLQYYPDSRVSSRGRTVLLLNKIAPRETIVQEYRSAVDSLTGDADRGREVFRKNCSSCHQLDGIGKTIGPNIATVTHRGSEALLTAILDPNREVNPEYVSYVVLTGKGRVVTGLIKAETESQVMLVPAEGEETAVPREEIETLKSSGQSLMPEGVEKTISHQDMADLLAYLQSPRSVE